MQELRIAIIGCGSAARIHLGRLLARPEVRVVGCADSDLAAAAALAALVSPDRGTPIQTADPNELLRQAQPQAVAIFTPHLMHYKPAMAALQAGCHVFIEKPLSTNAQEAVDIVRLAQARGRKVGVGHQFRLRPSLIEARRLLAEGAIGPLRLVSATLAQPWLTSHAGAEHSWRFDPKISGGGILADAGDHLLDALLWTTGLGGKEVAAIQSSAQAKLDVVTAAVIRLSDGTPATLAISGVSPGSLFDLVYLGEKGRLVATDTTLGLAEGASRDVVAVDLPAVSEDIDANFVAAIGSDRGLCCPAAEALETVRLLEAIGNSVASGQLVRVT